MSEYEKSLDLTRNREIFGSINLVVVTLPPALFFILLRSRSACFSEQSGVDMSQYSGGIFASAVGKCDKTSDAEPLSPSFLCWGLILSTELCW